MAPKNRCNRARIGDRPEAGIATGAWQTEGYGHRYKLRQSHACLHRALAKSTVCSAWSQRMTTFHRVEASAYLVFLGNFNLVGRLVVLLVDVHLQPPLRHPSHSRNCCQCQTFEQQFIDQVPRYLIHRLSAWVFHKLPSALLTAKSGFALVRMPGLDDLTRLALRTVHGNAWDNRHFYFTGLPLLFITTPKVTLAQLVTNGTNY